MKNPPAQNEYTSSGFFVLRTPLLPIEEFLKLSLPAADALQSQAAGSNRASVRAHLRQWAERPEVREALWIASPEFVQSLGAWWNDPESAKGRKLEHALYRYLARMTARATPFGAFAGCTTGAIADSTRLELCPRSQYRRSTRLDMEYLCSLAEHLSTDPAQRGNLRFHCNTSLHLAAGKYHHVRGDWQEGNHVFQLVATGHMPALEATLSRAASGATAGALVSALVESNPEIMPEDADAFVGRLIESQLLVADLVPPVTGVEAIRYMIDQLEQARASGLAIELRGIAEVLRELDQGGLGADPVAYDRIVSTVSRLGGEFKPGRLVQVDVIKPAATASLDRRLVNDILDAMQTLHSICHDSSQSPLMEFKEEFQDRYQELEVPLLEALDDETGIGFESHENPGLEPLLEGIDFRETEETPPAKDEEDKRVHPVSILARRLEQLLAKKETILELDSELVNELKAANPIPLPDAFLVMGSLFGRPGSQQGFYLQSIFGPSGANLLARLCHADGRLAEWVQAHVSAEEALHSGDAVFAEIAHLPEGRVGNVVCRPVLRRYEIPILATPGVPVDRQIALSDLTVSLRNDRIVLRSRRLGVEVLPRLTSAHNFVSSRSLKLYKFLCLLQHQDTCAELFWDWGEAVQAPFLPRVTRGNIVLSLARWRLSKELALELSQGRTPIEQWRQDSHVPRFVFIAEFDHQLLIDFENPLAVETFLEHIRKQEETLLVEMFPAPGALPVHGPEGSFVHEIILPMVRKCTVHKNKTSVHEMPADASQTRESVTAERGVSASGPGHNLPMESASDWLFAKLYCSPSHADRLLLELVAPLVEELRAEGRMDGWFFVRYADPHWHLRLRLHGDPGVLKNHVLPLLRKRAEPHFSLGTLWRLGFDSYEPETERYGGAAAITIAERVFQLDSILCLSLMDVVSKDDDTDLRWHLAVYGVDRLLTGLGFTLDEKRAMAKAMAESCEKSYVVDESYRKQLASKFRDERKVLAALCEDPVAAGVLPVLALSAFRQYAIGLEEVRRELNQLDRAGDMTTTLRDLAASLVHMHLNRLLRTAHRAQETVLYNFLSRAYAAKLASP
ncbi:MAG: lantibiotic dehydratase [Acidobacteriia bacterium]|nr:lantibiotic dehydratase [Terriglobia bacterium]